MKIDPRLHDHARDILEAAPDLTDDQRADLYDHVYDTHDSGELTQRLSAVEVPDDLKASLIAAKKLSDPEPTSLDKVVAAINRLAEIDPKVLDLAEAHPNLLKTLTATANKE